MSSIIGKEVDVVLVEDLARLFGVDYLKARQAGRRSNWCDFYTAFGALERMLGVDAAVQIVREGDFLEYSKRTQAEYFALARQLAGRGTVADFYSIGSLQVALHPPVQKEDTLENAALQKCRLFRDDSRTQGYLNSLIATGELAVDEEEHWSSSGTSGPRGRQIVSVIRIELKHLFAAYNWPKPKLEIHSGSGGGGGLSIDAESREYLRKARDFAYSIAGSFR